MKGNPSLESVIKGISSLLLRVLLALMGLVFVASLLLAASVLLALWSLRALWLRLTGRPVQSPLAFTIMRSAQWQRFYRPGAASPPARPSDEVIDVESRQVSSEADPQDRFRR
ncbi:MAG: hypothetical protein OEW36_08985 [Hylemonella sp.]|nr:hypothetical protein [Hylemonella sp.]